MKLATDANFLILSIMAKIIYKVQFTEISASSSEELTKKVDGMADKKGLNHSSVYVTRDGHPHAIFTLIIPPVGNSFLTIL